MKMTIKQMAIVSSLFFSFTALADTLECLPVSQLGPATEIVSKGFFNSEKNTMTLILDNGKSLSGDLVDASQLGKGALSFNEETTAKTGLNVTVMSSGGKIYAIVSPFMSMSLPQQLVCK